MMLAAVGAGLLVALQLALRSLDRFDEFPESLNIHLADPIDDLQDWIQENRLTNPLFTWFLELFRHPVNDTLDGSPSSISGCPGSRCRSSRSRWSPGPVAGDPPRSRPRDDLPRRRRAVGDRDGDAGADARLSRAGGGDRGTARRLSHAQRARRADHPADARCHADRAVHRLPGARDPALQHRGRSPPPSPR